jgi:hypothetical protein
MVDELCAELHNYFVTDVISGAFTVADLAITVPGLRRGQYFRVSGSIFNDGVHRYGNQLCADETFEGTIAFMAVPPALECVATEIETWKEKNAETITSPYQSESFGGYSYTKPTGSAASWQAAFASRLNRWRKI